MESKLSSMDNFVLDSPLDSHPITSQSQYEELNAKLENLRMEMQRTLKGKAIVVVNIVHTPSGHSILNTPDFAENQFNMKVKVVRTDNGSEFANHKDANLFHSKGIWVWDLYGKGHLLEAVDIRLSKEFDEWQLECLMIVGLWCCHPDSALRPPIRQVINVLNFEAPLPSLPAKLPVPIYCAPPMSQCKFSYTSSGLTTSESSCTTNSSLLTGGSTKSLLKQGKHNV
ncbi:L-type lectin-domain containing receptor kinase IV.1-like [Hevea brasiliensis]|uniref:L-type lectin-domain containing receptor kinase IV.1-like n=1 Tax=Hevea brasiliensis TaxID=3981 RepID=UPI0025F8577C|nr:L-type lectin-domain containing receptor kinase IV.1-like [Hevea brasiliensis]